METSTVSPHSDNSSELRQAIAALGVGQFVEVPDGLHINSAVRLAYRCHKKTGAKFSVRGRRVWRIA